MLRRGSDADGTLNGHVVILSTRRGAILVNGFSILQYYTRMTNSLTVHGPRDTSFTMDV